MSRSDPFELSESDEYSSKFKKALKEGDISLLRRIPKSDLHNHAALGMRFSRVQEKFGSDIIPPPDYMQGLEAFADYLADIAFLMDSRENVEFLLTSCLEAAENDGVSLLEASIDATFLSFYPKNEDFFNVISSLKDEFSSSGEFRSDLGVARVMDEDKWERYVPPCIESGVFDGIDLYDIESVNHLSLYENFYQQAEEAGLTLKVHVGEFCSPEQIEETIERLNPDVIQHGITAVKSENTLRMIEERSILLNIAITSNLKLGAVEKISDHPLPEIYRRGIPVTLNTDDLMIFDSSVSEEYLKAYEAGLLEAEELDRMRRLGLYWRQHVQGK